MSPWERIRQYAAKTERTVVGLMSGTSLDGVDAALVRISGSGRETRATEVAFVTIPFPVALRERVLGVSHGQGNAEEASRLNFLLGDLFADAVDAVLMLSKVQPSEIDLIASHGQTISHSPPAATLQIGEASVMALRFGIPVVSDFRTADVAAGGQGAPLVPYVDWCLFTHPTKSRVIQNIGGIGNVTYLAPNALLKDVIGFDTGPGNMLIDQATQWVSGGALLFDVDGALAESGTVDTALLDRLVAASPFLAQQPPKSAGREEFGYPFFKSMTDGYGSGPSQLAQRTMVTTMTAFTVRTIADAYRRYLPVMPDEIIVGGGGAKNPILMRMLQEQFDPIPIYTHGHLGINSDSKEAVAFAVLANETALGKTSNVPSVTGASHNVVLGKLTLPPV